MGNGNKVEMFIAICALVSSLAAVFIAWDQGRVMRAQQHGEVFPVIQVDGFSNNTSDYSDLGLNVRNSGVGPALVESVTLEVDGETIESFGTILAQAPGNYDITRSALTGRALAPGEQVTLIELGWTRENATISEIAALALQTQAWQLKICYCSVFERCWRTSGFGNARAERVQTCPRKETDLFTNFVPVSPAPSRPASSTTEQPSADGETQ